MPRHKSGRKSSTPRRFGPNGLLFARSTRFSLVFYRFSIGFPWSILSARRGFLKQEELDSPSRSKSLNSFRQIDACVDGQILRRAITRKVLESGSSSKQTLQAEDSRQLRDLRLGAEGLEDSHEQPWF